MRLRGSGITNDKLLNIIEKNPPHYHASFFARYKNLNEIKRNIPPKLFYFKESLEKSHDYFFEKDHWEDLSPKDITFYKDLTEHWLKTKTRRQRRIWNYFVLGVPKNSIAPRLKENTSFVARTIITLQKDFLDLIFKN